MIDFRRHAVAYGQQVGIVGFLAVAYRFLDILFAIVELLGCQTDSGKRVERAANLAVIAFFLA